MTIRCQQFARAQSSSYEAAFSLHRDRPALLVARAPRRAPPRPHTSVRALAAPASVVAPQHDARGTAAHDADASSGSQTEWAGYLPNCRGAAVVSLAGKENGRPKPANQDSFLTHTVQPSSPASVIGVFDGHGRVGHVASARVKDTMAAVLESCARLAVSTKAPSAAAAAAGAGAWDAAEPQEPPSPRGYAASNLATPSAMSTGAAAMELTSESAQTCLEATFSRAAESMRAAAVDFMQSGSTAVVCMLLPGSVVAAWAGDSRAVVGVAEGGSYTAYELTKDHKPNNLTEMARIMAAGGRVARTHKDRDGNPIGPFRVFLPVGRTSPGLSVARAFGDILLSSVGIIPTPDFAVFPLRASAAYDAPPSGPGHVLIVASDGLWEFVSSQTAVDIATAAGSPEKAAQLLAEAAQQCWEAAYKGLHCDDITVGVAYLD